MFGTLAKIYGELLALAILTPGSRRRGTHPRTEDERMPRLARRPVPRAGQRIV